MNKIVLDNEERDYLLWREGSGGTIEICDILVMSGRREGKGRQLIDKLLKEMIGKTHLVFAFTRPTNRISQDFYEGIGFKPYGVIPWFYSNPDLPSGVEEAVIWGRAL